MWLGNVRLDAVRIGIYGRSGWDWRVLVNRGSACQITWCMDRWSEVR